ncbi:MAG TPA: RNA polymerase sigma factor [Desulfobulbus sp.]|nr:RNA polymerase sigma factor [Desulfobulbus sp.]
MRSNNALDLVQDAMLNLVQPYHSRPEHEWGPLFYRVLQNKIRDWRRKTAVRNRWHGFLTYWRNDDNEETDPIQQVEDITGVSPEKKHLINSTTKALMTALHRLPPRQQQAFLLRAWEGMSVTQTAFAMQCSEGSVKTHYSRAIHALRTELREYWQ